jgi:type I restriction-modification system DNA methylase subunit
MIYVVAILVTLMSALIGDGGKALPNGLNRVGSAAMGLFNHRIVSAALKSQPVASEAQREVARLWAESIRNHSIHGQNESQIESVFHTKLLVGLLGYRAFDGTTDFTFRPKQPMAHGEADVVLGHFGHGGATILAPLELKGTDTPDLDAPVKGKSESTVQQAWRYANAISGIKWVLASNMLEIRLYAFGEGQQDYERIDLAKIDQPEELAKAQLLLSAENLLGTRLSHLLLQSKFADKELSGLLYSDYSALRVKLIDAVNAATTGADKVQAVNTAQKILDRVLFVAFAEDRGLLPQKSLEGAFVSKDKYNPKPVWENFKSLFRWIDLGNPQEDISKYNGGLFKFDDKVDRLELSDNICHAFHEIGKYHFDTDVSITVLGHIFEQSVSDVEKLLAKARGEGDHEPEKTSGVKGRRKRDGIVYTPDYIAKFIVEKTLGTHVEELFRSTMTENAKAKDGDYYTFKRGAELVAWNRYKYALKNLRVVDPACGSGVFLVTAFDFLKDEYDRVNKKVAELRGTAGQADIEDVDREILSQNLYGVDVNAESVEITKLSLWLKTAKQGKELDSLDHNIRVGDSLIEDSNFAYLKHGLSWNRAFPEVFAAGGFDVVLGNPPYVRQELLKNMKPYLQKHFDVYHGVADLYCYFFERGLRLLKHGGRLGYISSSTFFKTSSGSALRSYLKKHAALDSVTDFGDLQIFEGVTTYPAILTMRKSTSSGAFKFWKVKAIPEGNFGQAFGESAQDYPQDKLSAGSWELESDALRQLRDKIVRGKKTLKQVYGSPNRGVLTGFNKAFVIDRKTRDRLIADDSNSEELIKPWLEGKDLKRWRAEPRDIYMIFTRRGVDIEKYPAILSHLEKFRGGLEPKPENWRPKKPNDKWLGRKSGSYKWYEIQDSIDYYQEFEKSKISYPHFNAERNFFCDASGSFSNDKSYLISSSSMELLGYLNSSVAWFLLTGMSPPVRGGFHELRIQYVETLTIPSLSQKQKAALALKASSCLALADETLGVTNAFTRRIRDLCPPNRDHKLTTKLLEWWKLADFAAFRVEVKKTFKADIAPKERNDWEDLFTTGKADTEKLVAEIKRNENEINVIVYQLFDLKPKEIALLEQSIGVT